MTWNIKEKTALVTGANSGIGRAIAHGLAAEGARVIMASRNEKRGEKARRDIVARTGNARVHLALADLSTTAGVRSLATQVLAMADRLEILVNNAALLTGTRRVTAEGHELQLFVNHLAPFMLTHLLLDRIRGSSPARIINITSTAHSSGAIDFDNLQLHHEYKGYKQYANTKLMNVIFTYELARRLEGTGVTANCVHPGIIHTNLLRNFSSVLNLLFHAFGRFFKHPREGADTPVYMATAPELADVSGKYFKYRDTLGTSEVSYDRDVQQRLWQASIELTGVEPAV